jgi:hypothetical protein
VHDADCGQSAVGQGFSAVPQRHGAIGPLPKVAEAANRGGLFFVGANAAWAYGDPETAIFGQPPANLFRPRQRAPRFAQIVSEAKSTSARQQQLSIGRGPQSVRDIPRCLGSHVHK